MDMSKDLPILRPLTIEEMTKDMYLDGAILLDYILQFNNFQLIVAIARYKGCDYCETTEMILKYWQLRYRTIEIRS